MRLFVASVLSLLAVSSGAYAAAVAGYPNRAELHAYNPASGEFAAVNALTPDYAQYINQQAAAQLFGYESPEPIQSRRITYEEYLNQLVKGTLKDETEQIKKRDEHFRLWAVQVYDQYRKEVDRLKAAGKEPSVDTLAKLNAFEVVLTSPKHDNSQDTSIIKQLREEHLRFWNESRRKALEALQKEEALAKPTTQLTDASEELTKDAPTQAAFLSETAEQKKEGEEHLLIYHLRVLQEMLKKAEFVNEVPVTSENNAELPVQKPPYAETLQQSLPLANNEQLAAAKSAPQTETSQSQPQAPVGVQETAEVQRAREEHLKLVKEAYLKASQTSQTAIEPKPTLYDASADKITEPSADEEARLRAEEAKQREAELLAETERLREEQRLQAEELLRLQQEEQRRQEQERLALANENKEAEHNAEKPQLPIVAPPKETLDSLILSQYQTDPAATHDIRDKEKYTDNPYLLRYAGANANQIGSPIATTAYYLGAQQKPVQQQQSYASPGVYYLRDANEGYLKLDNPYFLHYITNKQGGKDTLATADAASLASALAALHQVQQQPIAASFGQKPTTPFIPIAPLAPSAPITPIAPAAPILPIAPIAPTAENMKILYGNEAALAALEKATREHFRAHEIALEQLRLASQKQPLSQKDCY
ncbi:uncharacterized protein LOC105209888 [Zeugodacus cucurbitae]|uniref:uncharacterized protein LOC105209888 n=1 Tax=Zeugodacus cucurbitae TaxID=28588 RepID=UPI0023D90732|nr:uncharacterized protein LOC105209888 [Zeugodacus cucurbitae]